MVKRALTIFILAVLVLVLGGTGVALLVYPPEYVFRLLAWRSSDVGDVDRFPAQRLATLASPVVFADARDEQRVRRVFGGLDEAAEIAGMTKDDAVIPDLGAFLAGAQTQSFVVLKDGALLYEEYLNGASRETVVTSFSTAKSFTSALVGIAVAEGSIASIDDPITDYLPELAERDPAFSGISVRDLLHMSSGIHYEEFPFFHGDDAKTYYYPDLRALALWETRVDGPPGEAFHYNNYHPLLLGLILERATGTPVATYLQDRLWKPLGMEYEGSWSLDGEKTAFPKMESGINGRAIDFAKFGQLFLDEGSWRDEVLIPAEWVALSTTPAPAEPGYYPEGYSADDGRSLGYGLMWWTLDVSDREGDGAGGDGGRRDYMAWGKHGQIIFVSPASGVVVVRNGAAEGASLGRWFRLLSELAAHL